MYLTIVLLTLMHFSEVFSELMIVQVMWMVPAWYLPNAQVSIAVT